MKEFSGIVWWAVQGLRKLQMDGQLIESPSAMEWKVKASREATPIRSFVTDRCDRDPTYSESKDRLYEAYEIDCAQHDHTAMPRNSFLSAVAAAV